MSPRKLFEQELEELRQDVLQMAEWVQDGYDCLFAALEKKDGDQMRRYVRHDRTIEDMQRNIESQCLSLLTRQTPVARDLRTVSAALKVVTDLERIGNHLSDMAELFVRMDLPELSRYSPAFPDMVRETRTLIGKAARAFVERNMAMGQEAIDADDAAMMREELGDVLMQVAFHTVIEEERGRFDFEQVCREVCEKLVFRHPNIFASSAAENAGINSWDALKNKEKGRTTLADELNTVPATLPALMYAQKMQKRAARKGAFAQTAEDAAAALKAAECGWEEAVPENAAERAGALLFAAANAMRLAGVDAEEALTFASGRFRQELLQKTEDSDGQERPATV